MIKTLGKAGLLFFLIGFCFTIVLADAPEFPHVVHGEVNVSGEDYNGSVFAVKSGEVIDDVSVNEGLFEDLLIQGVEQGDEVNLSLEGMNGEPVDTGFNEDLPITYNPGAESDIFISVNESDYNLAIDDTNSPVEEGEILEVEVELVNDGDLFEEPVEIILEVEGDEEDSLDSLEVVDSELFTLEWNSGDEGDYEIEVLLEKNTGISDTMDIEVEAVEEDDDGNGDDAPPGDDDDDDNGDEEEFDEEKIIDIDGGEERELEFSESPIDSLTISVDEFTAGQIKSRATEERPDDAGSSPDGEVFEYVEFEITDFDNDDITEVVFGFEVDRDWLDNNDIEEELVVLQRYDDGWNDIDTSIVESNDDYVEYEAFNDGFSIYSITGKDADSVFEVTGLEVEPMELDQGETIEVNVTVENTGSTENDYELPVEVGEEEIPVVFESVGAGETASESFETAVNVSGNVPVVAGEEEIELEVEAPVEEDEGGISWLFVIGFVLIILLLIGSVLIYVEYPEKVSELRDELEDILHLPEDDASDYSFEGFAEDDDF